MKITDKMLDFFMKQKDEFLASIGYDIDKCTFENGFKFLYDKITNHEDEEIRVEFMKFLMYKGYQDVVKTIVDEILTTEYKGTIQ